MKFYQTIFSPILLFFALSASAQDGSTIKAAVDKKKILIGEPLQLTIEAYYPAGSKRVETIDTIEHFELLEPPVTDSSKESGGIRIKALYKLTSFDSGHWVIPSFSISETIKTDTIPIDVVFSDFDPNQEYHDIKDILEVKVPEKKNEWWWYALSGALLLALIIWLLKKKKTPPVAAPRVVSTINPYEEAMQQLELLNRDKPAAKLYHSRLADIFRLYIFRKKGILSLQKTTDDLVIQLKGLGLEKEQFDKLSQSLRLGDFVKFAKYLPAEEDDQRSFQEIRNAIITIEKTEANTLPPGGGKI
ncbi:MAG: LPXTG cell wall anchor domain-containing protein [Chitinophagaceae bacterium]|nr:LPXTG cell wall anchor domain-containing protein [Chitinophagaceae bacterium]